ncbi:hypothetical protein FZ989_00355 [Clostridium perfringens]|nr:hypothetical protein [Clostridium perfringens]
MSNSQFNSMANKIYKTKIVKENNIVLDKNIYYAEDWLFNIQTIIHASNIEYINKQFYYYRRGHESSSSFMMKILLRELEYGFIGKEKKNMQIYLIKINF